MQKQPILIILIAFVLGIVFQDKLTLSDVLIWSILGGSFIFQLLFFLNRRWINKCRGGIIGLFFFAIGVFSHSFQQVEKQVALNPDTTYEVNFDIDHIESSNLKYRKYRVIARIDSLSSFPVLLYVPKKQKRLDFEHHYRAVLKIHEITSSSNGYGFDYYAYMKRKNVFYQAFLFSDIGIAKKSSISLADRWRMYRQKWLRYIEKSPLSSTTQSFMKSVVLGDKTDMDKTVYHRFKRSGMVHVLVISGMHIAIVFGFFYFLFSWLPVHRKKVIFLSLVCIWLFGLFIGLGNAVFRACLMLSIYYVFYFLQRKQDFIHTWSLAMFIILMMDTQQLFDVGFQLSFSAVFGIFWLYQPLMHLFPMIKYAWLRFLTQIFCVTLSAQLGVLPFILYYFHATSLVGVFSNIILVPFIQIIVICSFLTLAMIPFSDTFLPIISLYDHVVQYLVRVVYFLSELKWAYTDNIPFHGVEAIVLMLIVYFLRDVIRERSFRNISRLGYLFCFFVMIRLGVNFYYHSKDEIVVHNLYHKKIISVKKGEKVTFYVQTDNNHKRVYTHIIAPYLVYIRGGDYKVVLVSNNCKSVSFDGLVYDF